MNKKIGALKRPLKASQTDPGEKVKDTNHQYWE